MIAFPPVARTSEVDHADRSSAIDFVNRVNWFFETWDIEAMIDAFLPEGVAYHSHGTIRGRKEMRRFFEQDYLYLIPGVSRNATNHIVDVDEDGVAVRYQNLLIRHAKPEDAPALCAGQIMRNNDGLPAIWVYSPVRDRLRRTESGWKIYERYIGGSTTNVALTPTDTSVSTLAVHLPKAGAVR